MVMSTSTYIYTCIYIYMYIARYAMMSIIMQLFLSAGSAQGSGFILRL